MLKVNLKAKKPVLTLAVVIVLGIGIYMIFGRGASVSVLPDPPAGSNLPVAGRAFPVAEKDAGVYSVVDAYMQAQIKNNREEVLTMLTEQKQNIWTDGSYLLNEAAFRDFDQIQLVNLKLGVITFNRREAGETAAMLATFDIHFIKGDEVAYEIALHEELGLMQLEGNWLIDYSARTEANRKS